MAERMELPAEWIADAVKVAMDDEMEEAISRNSSDPNLDEQLSDEEFAEAADEGVEMGIDDIALRFKGITRSTF